MEEIKGILSLFDSAETWDAFIELSEMRTGLVNELSSRLMVELQKIAKENLNFLLIVPYLLILLGASKK